MPELQPYIESGDVFYVVKDLPLYEIHPQAVSAAATTECAGAQDAYWPMHDLLFENQAAWSGNPDTVAIFTQYATDLGLDTEAFATCMSTEEVVLEIAEDLEGGAAAGVTGTPAFFINGEFINGAVPFETFQQIIEAHLN
jgi:protein-disulfide isomerase